MSLRFISQTCPVSVDGRDKANQIRQVEFKCQSCKDEAHADEFGAINILRARHARLN